MLITGGARSGKSRFAEGQTLALPRPAGKPAVYIATAEAWDEEMEARIAAHRARRGAEWRDLHAPFDVLAALRETDDGTPRVVDCVTLWLTNMMLAEKDWEAALSQLADAIPHFKSPTVFVTNEVGLGIVPENALARRFRDAQGICNAAIAEACEAVWLVVAGQPLRIK